MLAGLLNVSIMWLINGEGEGLETPEEALQPSDDMRALLTEMRGLRASMLQDAAALGRLEKRLRLMMTGPADV
jgi:hypothetical protein